MSCNWNLALTEPGARVREFFDALTDDERVSMLKALKVPPRLPEEVGFGVTYLMSNELKRRNGYGATIVRQNQRCQTSHRPGGHVAAWIVRAGRNDNNQLMIYGGCPMERRSLHILAGLVTICVSFFANHSAIAQNTIATVGEPQDKIVISSGVDVVALSGIDVVAIVPDRMLMDHISDPLVRTDANGEIIPWLATSWTNIDPLVWELKLRKGVKFQNGELFNANSVKYFYDLMRDPKFVSPTKSNHSWTTQVDVVDDYTVRIHTATPDPVVPGKLSLAQAIPPEYIKQVGIDGYRKHPIGTGPYRLTEYVRDDHSRWRLSMAGGPVSLKSKRSFTGRSRRPQRVFRLSSPARLTSPSIYLRAHAAGRTRQKRQHQKTLSVRTFFLFLNTINPSYPTSKREVREAINYAIDRESLNKNILGGTGAPAAWLNPKTFGIDPSLKPVPYDPARAKMLLAEAGYPNGIDIKFELFSGALYQGQGTDGSNRRSTSQVGIRTQVEINEWGFFTKKMWIDKSDAIALLARVDNVGDPDIQNYRVLKSGGNWSQNADPELDVLLNQIASEMNSEKRKALIIKQQHYMRKSYPLAYLLQIGIICGVSPKLEWWEPMPNDAHRFFRVTGESQCCASKRFQCAGCSDEIAQSRK